MAYEIVITRPCTDAPGRFIAESSFGRRFAMGRLCALAKAIDGAKGFSDLKCSESLGVAKFDYRGRTLILYKSGRIDLRRIVDADDALAVMHDIEERLKDAFEQ